MYFLRPANAAQAHRNKTELGSACAYVAGGTALQLSWRETPEPRLTLIDVTQLLDMSIVYDVGSGLLRIGCALRIETLRRDPTVRERAPLLAAACDEIASVSVRNVATLGGNIGWRFGDTLAPLLAMRAAVELHSGEVAPLDTIVQFHECPLIVAVHLPASDPRVLAAPVNTASGVANRVIGFYEKVGRRAAFTPSRIALALHAKLVDGGRLEDVCIAVTGAGLVARILARTGETMEGTLAHSLTPEAIRDACWHDLPEDPTLARIASRVVSGHVRAACAKDHEPSSAP